VKRKIVVSLISEEQEFQRLQASTARAASQGQVEIEVLFAEANAILQIQQLFRHIHAPDDERPLAIVVEPVSVDGIKRVAKAAVSAGIGWMLLSARETYLAELAQQAPTLPIAAVSSDDEEIGRIQGQQIAALLPGGGAILYVEGPPHHAASPARRKGMESATRNRGIRIEKTLVGDWSEASADRALRSWFRLKTSAAMHIDLIACQNDHMAMGVRKVLAADRPEWLSLPLTGCDGLPEGGQREVQDGRLTATVLKPPTTGAAIELLLKAERGERIPPYLVLSPRSIPPIAELHRR
jgi:ABC-type sugar transport system substrate-binding protein